MNIFVTGDIHGHLSIDKLSYKNWPESRKLTQDDYLIICGDFGLLWNNPPKADELYWLKWLQNRKFTTLVVDGNHENHVMLQNLKQIRKFGGTVGQINDKVYHLKRGQIYTIEDKRIFAFGGAESMDKADRALGISWWPEEIATFAEMNAAIDQLQKFNNKVDYIVTHTAPTKYIDKIVPKLFVDLRERMNDPTCKFLDYVLENIEFKQWFCGHFHMDTTIDNVNFLFNNIVKI